MRPFHYLIFVLLAISISIAYADDVDECTANEEMSFDTFSVILNKKKMYQAKIELVDRRDRRIDFIEENHDFTTQNAHLEHSTRRAIGSAGSGSSKVPVTEKYVYLNVHKEYFQTNDFEAVCDVSTMDNDKYAEILLKWTKIADIYKENKDHFDLKPRIIGPSSLLFLLDEHFDDSYRYHEQDVNKNPLYVYNLCFGKNKDTNQYKYMIKYKIFKEKNLNQYLPQSIVIRTRPDTTDAKFEDLLIYNYYLFNVLPGNKISDDSPIGHGCERLENANPTQTDFGKKAEMDFEYIVSSNGNTNIEYNRLYISEIDEYYVHYSMQLKQAFASTSASGDNDDNGNADPTSRQLSLSSQMPHKTIYDKRSMLVYVINQVTGECKIHKQNTPKVDDFDWNDAENLITRGSKVLWASEKYHYLGRAIEREITCLVYEAVVPDFGSQLKLNTEYIAIITHYYPKSKYFWVNNNRNINVPIKIAIKLYNGADTKRSHIIREITLNYNKFAEYYDVAVTDLSDCADTNYEWFQVIFIEPESRTYAFREYTSEWIEAFRATVQVTDLRMPNVLIDFDDNEVRITAKLLEPVAMRYLFNHESDKTFKDATRKMLLDTEEECARKCFTNGKCIAYSYCSSRACELLITDYVTNGMPEQFDLDKKTKENVGCQVSKRRVVVRTDEIDYWTNHRLLADLKQKIEEGNFVLKLVKQFNVNATEFKAESLKIDVQPGGGKNADHIDRFDDVFEVVYPDSMYDANVLQTDDQVQSRVLYQVEMVDCEMLCLNDNGCHSFSYCNSDSKQCILTDFHAVTNMNNVTQHNEQCTISRKRYLSRYEQHENRALSTVARVLYKDFNSDEDGCAKECTQQKDFECRSFDYCEGVTESDDENTGGTSIVTCMLHSMHFIANRADENQTIAWDYKQTHCDHYSRKYSLDYKQHYHEQFVKADLGTFDEVSLERCATECNDAGLGNCVTFEYCTDIQNNEHVTTCRLNSNAYGDIKVSKSAKCSVYELESGLLNRKTKSPKLYSTTLTIFLSFVSVLSGAIIGAAVCWIIVNKVMIIY